MNFGYFIQSNLFHPVFCPIRLYQKPNIGSQLSIFEPAARTTHAVSSRRYPEHRMQNLFGQDHPVRIRRTFRKQVFLSDKQVPEDQTQRQLPVIGFQKILLCILCGRY